MNGTKTEKAEILLSRWNAAAAERDTIFQHRKECEDLYYSDVEGTFTTFNQKQLREIQSTYNIPISIRLAYPIIEQLISFVTSAKPYPDLISTTPNTQDFTMKYQDMYKSLWYESQSDKQLRMALSDAFVVGQGFMRVCKDNYYNQTTFKVIHEHVPWKQVFVDPTCTQEDLSDAGYVIIASILPKRKVEGFYGIKVRTEDVVRQTESTGYSQIMDIPIDKAQEYLGSHTSSQGLTRYNDDEQPVWIREFYEQETRHFWISNNNDIAIKKPVANIIPNPKKEELYLQMQELYAQLEQADQNTASGEIANEALNAPEASLDEAGFNAANEVQQEAEQAGMQAENDFAVMQQELEAIQQEYDATPSKITVYKMTTVNKDEIILQEGEFERAVEKVIKYTKMIGTHIHESYYIPELDRLPIIQFAFHKKNNVNRSYGLIHNIKDMLFAMDKTLAMLLYDMQLNGHRKIMYVEGSLVNPVDWENKWSQTGAFLAYEPNANLPNGGQPTIIEHSPLNQNIPQLLDRLFQYIEYITGMNSLMMGDGGQAPKTLGATSQLLSYGSQRPKLYGRIMEKPLEILAEVSLVYLQLYAPKELALQFFGQDGGITDISFSQPDTHIRFKCRVNIEQNLAVTKQHLMETLALLAQQTGDPVVQNRLTMMSLEQMDNPVGAKLSQDIDLVKQLQGQVEQLNQAIKEKDGELKSMANNMKQKEISSAVDLETQKAKNSIDTEKAKATTQIVTEKDAVLNDNDEPIL
jgi:hypothetical protein